MKTTNGRTGPATTHAKRAEILQALRAAVALLHRSTRSVERTTGLTNAQLFILQQLQHSEPRSISDLAAVVMTQQSTVSLVVSRLEHSGFVRRTRSADDARRSEVTLTPRGRRQLREAPTPPVARILAALDTLSRRDVDALHRGLAAFSTALGVGDDDVGLMFEPQPGRRKPSPAATQAASRTAAQGVSRPRRSLPGHG